MAGGSGRTQGPSDMHGHKFKESASIRLPGQGADKLSAGMNQDLGLAGQVQWRKGRQRT